MNDPSVKEMMDALGFQNFKPYTVTRVLNMANMIVESGQEHAGEAEALVRDMEALMHGKHNAAVHAALLALVARCYADFNPTGCPKEVTHDIVSLVTALIIRQTLRQMAEAEDAACQAGTH